MIDQAEAASSHAIETTDTPDCVTVLRTLNGRPQTKTFSGPGATKAERPRLAKRWRHEVLELFSLDDVEALLRRLEDEPGAIIVRGELIEGTDPRGMLRRSTAGKDGEPATLAQVDHHWLCVDLDGVAPPPSLKLHDRATWTAAARELIKAHLPEGFHGAGCVLQWSSSAGLKAGGVASCHLWFYSLRPVCSQALHAWAKTTATVDPSTFVDVQPHYVGRPVFVDGALDPLPGARVWRVPGRPFVKLPEEVTGIVAWKKKVEAQRAARNAERASRAASVKASGFGSRDADHDEAMIASALEALGCDDRDDWIKYGQALHAWSAAKNGDGRGLFIRWSQGSAKFDAADLERVWRSFGAERGRGAGSIIHAARAAGWRSPGELKRDRAERRVKPDAPRKQQQKEDTTMTRPTPAPRSPSLVADASADDAAPSFLALGDLVVDDAAPALAHLEEVTDPELLTVAECRAAVRGAVCDAIERGGVTMLRAPAGIGKTRVMVEHIVTLAREDRAARFAVVVPTHALGAELVRAYRTAAPDVWTEEATVRDERSCVEHDWITACGRVGSELARRACLDCDLHPNNQGGEPACNFMKNRGGRGAQIQIMTHALWSLTAETIDDEFLPDVVVIDESVWSQCVLTEALQPGHIAELIGQGALTTEHMLPDGTPPTDMLLRLCQRSIDDGRRITSGELQAALGDALGAGDEEDERYALEVYGQAQGASTHAAALQRLGEAAGWKGRKGLRASMGRQWRGSYIQHGRLHVGDVQRFPATAHRAVIALDATATLDTANAFFGRGCVYEELQLQLPAEVELIKAHADLGPASHIGPGQDESRINQARLGALLLRYASHPGALAVVMKSWLTEGSTSAAIIRAACEQAHVIWHNGIDARGSNAYRLCDTVVVTHYRVPRGVAEQAGELLAEALDEEHELAMWTAVARLQLEAAPLAQAAARIRFLDADADHPKRVIFAAPGDVGFEMLGLGAAQRAVEVDLIMWEELGVPSTTSLPEVVAHMTSTAGVIAPTRLARDMTGALPWREVLPEATLRGRCILQAIGGATEPESRSAYKTPADLPVGSVISNINGIGESAGRWVFNQVKNHWRGDWSMGGVLETLGVRTALVEVRGVGVNKALPVWVPEGLRGGALIAQLEGWAALAGADAWRLPGEPAWRNVHRVEQALVHALALVQSELEPLNTEVTLRDFFADVAAGMPAAEGWSWRRVERALERTRPAEVDKRQHLSEELFKARATMHAQLVENEEEGAHVETFNAAEAAGEDGRHADHMRRLWGRLDAIGWLLSADLDRPLIPRRRSPRGVRAA